MMRTMIVSIVFVVVVVVVHLMAGSRPGSLVVGEHGAEERRQIEATINQRSIRR
jgi:hypothetical protein